MTSSAGDEAKETIRRIAFLNAILHGGKARTKPVLGKLLNERPKLKTRINEIFSLTTEIVEKVNRFSLVEQKKTVEEEWPEVLMKEKADTEKILPPLPNAKKYKKIITRFSPNPDCVLHLGSARAIVLNYKYAKKYDGKFYLRFEDTDPKLKKPELKFYDSIRQDISWLECMWDAEFIQSDRLKIYYGYTEKLLMDGNGYVCTCRPADFRTRVVLEEQCPCRSLKPEECLSRWNRMLDGSYKEGEAVVRVKTDIHHPNPAIRDWPALRIINTQRDPHPRVGSMYRVWPLYNFACSVDDHLMGITHVIRGKEHLTNQIRQEYLYHHFGWKYPEGIHYGRLRIRGASLSKSKILEGIKDGSFKDWDDPRLATLAALRRRGITPESVRRFMNDMGPKSADVVLSWKNLYAHNRKIIDQTANRYFFLQNPISLIIELVRQAFTIQIPLHPDHPELGFRNFEVIPKEDKVLIHVSKNDIEIMKRGKKMRLIGLFNAQIKAVKKNMIRANFHSESHLEARSSRIPLIHWIPAETGIQCNVMMPDGSIASGIAEESCRKLKPNQIVQFERFGFARVDRVDNKLKMYFTHR